ncbi:hypothetical protein Tco_1089920 [Tanacetum coccineum]|uniref:Uncharacterized protein n=1 Tax=Tanacetum coccineum TaxID=301880 RepID=A0ABQ5I4V7_9ASTR
MLGRSCKGSGQRTGKRKLCKAEFRRSKLSNLLPEGPSNSEEIYYEPLPFGGTTRGQEVVRGLTREKQSLHPAIEKRLQISKDSMSKSRKLCGGRNTEILTTRLINKQRDDNVMTIKSSSSWTSDAMHNKDPPDTDAESFKKISISISHGDKTRYLLTFSLQLDDIEHVSSPAPAFAY